MSVRLGRSYTCRHNCVNILTLQKQWRVQVACYKLHRHFPWLWTIETRDKTWQYMICGYPTLIMWYYAFPFLENAQRKSISGPDLYINPSAPLAAKALDIFRLMCRLMLSSVAQQILFIKPTFLDPVFVFCWMCFLFVSFIIEYVSCGRVIQKFCCAMF